MGYLDRTSVGYMQVKCLPHYSIAPATHHHHPAFSGVCAEDTDFGTAPAAILCAVNPSPNIQDLTMCLLLCEMGQTRGPGGLQTSLGANSGLGECPEYSV